MARRSAVGTAQGRTEGQALRIPVAPDGHYWVEATINGTSARFLIDSGATVTALSENTARAAGLNYDVGEPGVIMTTANGKVTAKRSSIATLAIVPFRRATYLWSCRPPSGRSM
ncbi:TIGR02281 family clan AA aspartic protease [Sphingobium sp. Z007]|uniref:retropepsin-like aspartic protease family protein n=1 Tax=Sphingobium sp. Z007 TaxID=627495 RepID=UPI00211ABC74|nr:retroviral-like aspartic protease family protein [Sphingobium sp. Z007]